MTVDPRIAEICNTYGLSKSDVWELPQRKGTYCIKHSALEIVAAVAGIQFDMPMIIEAKGESGVAAVCVRGTMKDRSVWSIGECSPKNNKNAYPWAMAEKRAIDRVVLKLVGIHGLVYSEEEADDFKADAPQPLPKAQARPIDREMRDEINACQTVEDLEILWRSKPFKDEFDRMPLDWQQSMIEHFKEHKALLVEKPPRGAVAPNFDAMERA